MATGDKFYIADKATLDAVNNRTTDMAQGINTVKNDTEIIKQGLSSLAADSRVSGSDREYYLPSEVAGANKKLIIDRTTLNQLSTSNMLNLTVPGKLYGFIVIPPVISNSDMQTVTVSAAADSISIYSSSLSYYTNSRHYGLVTKDSLIAGKFPLYTQPPIDITGTSIGNNPLSANNTIIYLPKPIKFQSSLRITASLATNNNLAQVGYVYYMYELD